eukprot:CAMPEP_0204613686 /NCGR_PEP_ID=MMETSP0717-20131115/1620_1 /ASSEMBLY_ACC=CAM_ASM_000666 /TAXON_ID=230516 /ORGANISM="Chaetoceros curvisetus" /LENGTH=97 /DNA_ID=CAMNT_0051626189 /DNA_START=234 /DNA_END=527 /DNA_ORIENTATION=-
MVKKKITLKQALVFILGAFLGFLTFFLNWMALEPEESKFMYYLGMSPSFAFAIGGLYGSSMSKGSIFDWLLPGLEWLLPGLILQLFFFVIIQVKKCE